MKIRYNRFLPTRRFTAINLFGFVFARHGTHISKRTIRHEKIHTRQMKEMLYIFFYVWYGLEYIFRLIQYRNFMKAYYDISFEREAYKNEDDLDYLNNRKSWSWFRYL